MKFKIAEPICDEAEIEAQLIIDEDGDLSLMIDWMVAVVISKKDLSLVVSLENYEKHENTSDSFIWKHGEDGE